MVGWLVSGWKGISDEDLNIVDLYSSVDDFCFVIVIVTEQVYSASSGGNC